MTRSDYTELVPLQQYKCLGSAVTYLYPNIPKSIWIHIDHVYDVCVCARVRCGAHVRSDDADFITPKRCVSVTVSVYHRSSSWISFYHRSL